MSATVSEDFSISSPGTLKTVAVGFPDVQSEGTTITAVTATTSDGDLTAPNAAPTSGSVTIGSTAYAAGEAVQFDIVAASAMTAGDYYVYLALTISGGESLNYRQRVRVSTYLDVQ